MAISTGSSSGSSLADRNIPLDLPGPDLTASEQVRRWIESPVAFWEQCARDHGALVQLQLGSLGTAVLISDPDTVRDVFRLPRDAYECHPYNEQYRSVMGDHSLLLQDGETHERRRRLFTPPFRHDQLLLMFETLETITEETIAGWPRGTAFDPRPGFHEFAFSVIVHFVLGDRARPASRELIASYREHVLPNTGSWSPWQRFTRMHPRIRALLRQEVEERRKAPEIAGMLTHLALARERHADVEDYLTDEEIADHVFSLLVAGVDTTALALTWGLYWLCREPAVHEKLRRELRTFDTQKVQEIFRLPYLHAVFCETLRMFPIVTTPSGRKLLREMEVGGRTYPAGVTLVPSTYLVHRLETLYPESSRFRPERFQNGKPASHEYFPFGGGLRTCVGEMMAQIGFKTAVRTILDRGTVRGVEVPEPNPVRHGALLAPPEGFRIVFEARS